MATRTPTPAQLAARERFAEMARSGVLNRKRQIAAKRNPITETLIYGLPAGETRDYMEELLYDGGLKLTEAQIQKVFDAASKAGYHSFRVTGFDPTKKPDFAKAVRVGRKRNPAKKTVSQKISQLVHEGYPQKQAVAVALNEQRAGKVKRNPRASKPKNVWQVSVMIPGVDKKWFPIGNYFRFEDAEKYARWLHKTEKWDVRVIDKTAL